MKVIVDTSVWSLALRRQKQQNNSIVNKLRDLISDGRVVFLGVVRQEILSGIKHQEQYEKLRDCIESRSLFFDYVVKCDRYLSTCFFRLR